MTGVVGGALLPSVQELVMEAESVAALSDQI